MSEKFSAHYFKNNSRAVSFITSLAGFWDKNDMSLWIKTLAIKGYDDFGKRRKKKSNLQVKTIYDVTLTCWRMRWRSGPAGGLLNITVSLIR